MAYNTKQYSVAIGMLQKEFNKAKSRSQKGKTAFLLAESYRQLRKSVEASNWFQTAYNNGYGSEALKGRAYSLKQSGQYKEAIDAFKQLGVEIGSPYEYKKEITACINSEQWMKDSLYNEYKINNLDFNSSGSEYGAFIYQNGSLIFSKDKNAEKKEKYLWTGKSFFDFVQTDKLGNVIPFQIPFNTKGNEATICFSTDYTESIFTSCNGSPREDVYCQLLYSRKSGDNWTAPEVLPFCVERTNYGHPCLSEDGNWLYFTSNKVDGWGGYDIYVVERKKGVWGNPTPLSKAVNTIGNEMFPFIDKDTLYFASDKHSGMGGLDIFKTYRKSGSYTPAQNLKAPVNSSEDDFGFVINYQTPLENGVFQRGYFSSNRAGGKGNDDIYEFLKTIPKERPKPVQPDTVKSKKSSLLLDIIVLEKIFEQPNNPNSKVLGRKGLPLSEIVVKYGNNEALALQSNEEGLQTVLMKPDPEYLISVRKEGYLNASTSFSMRGIAIDSTQSEQRFEVEIVMEKIFKNTEIILENIYYNFDKYDIREDAKPTLNKLAQTMKENPSIKIQLSAHTDCRGNDNYNLDLSQKRAQSVVDYLISLGIAPERLQAKGYGESQPYISCRCQECSETEHQANRRTTFKILDE